MILALIFAAATAAATPAQPAQPAAAAAGVKPAAEKMVCKTEAPIGTRFPKKVCRSAASIEENGRTEREAVQAAQRGYSQCGAASNTRC